MKTRVEASDEMLAFVGDGAIAVQGWPASPMGIALRLADGTMSIDPHPIDCDALADADVVLVVAAGACGINRANLTRGFRAMFRCSIADALAERRLGGARVMLLSTDLPVASVGYACGYLNAALTRAFSRRFGLPPSQLRAAA